MASVDDGATDVAVDNKLINEEYKIWKKNAVFLYDIIYSRALEWPTLTTQWLPDVQRIPNKSFSSHRLLIGTHTSTDAQNYLQIAQINLPNPPAANPSEYDPEREELGGFGAAKEPITFQIIQKINHPGEVNKARYMPQNPDIIATMTIEGDALVFDRTKHTSNPRNSEIEAQIVLKGHKSEGFGLNWNPHTEGQLATGSEDKTVRIWYAAPSLFTAFFIAANTMRQGHQGLPSQQQDSKCITCVDPPLSYSQRRPVAPSPWQESAWKCVR